MTDREVELLTRFVMKANPPPMLYRYRRAADWTIKELRVPEVHVTGIDDINDPFEYRAPLKVDVEMLRRSFYEFCREQRAMSHEQATEEAKSVNEASALHLHAGIDDLRSRSGLVCCSRDAHSNRMWAYYGDSHKGVCIGYNTSFAPFSLAHEVSYSDPAEPIDLLATLQHDPSDLGDLLSCRKGAEWSFEQEFRVPVGPFPEDHTRLLPVQPEAIAEIRLGVRIDADFKAEVIKTAQRLPIKPRIYQMNCDCSTFRLTESLVSGPME